MGPQGKVKDKNIESTKGLFMIGLTRCKVVMYK